MDLFDSEIEIIKAFQDVTVSSVMLAPEGSKACESLYLSIKELEQWNKWTDSSGKADLPPDFYSDELGYMMDVMRVDDHGYHNKKGKTVNPTRQRETEIARELRENGIIDAFPTAKLIMTVDTKLPTREDHNYTYYRKNFVRTIEAHKKKISNYKTNHPSLKTVFLVFDESSQYMQTTQKIEQPKIGLSVMAMPHLWWCDSEFVKAFQSSEIDYLIWFTPYKHCEMYDQFGNAVTLPTISVIDTKMIIDAINYDESLMESVEI